VWIDSASGVAFNTTIKRAFVQIAARYPNLKDKALTFDVIIITHWDNDHCSAFKTLLRNNKLEPHLKSGTPRTRLLTSTVSCNSRLTNAQEKDEHVLRVRTKSVDVYVGPVIMGTDVFDTDTIGLTGWESMKSLDNVLAAMKNNGDRPHMLIVSVDAFIMGQPGRVPYVKKDAEQYAIYDGERTDTNASSVGVIIVWPKTKRISHYTTGDLHWDGEYKLAEFLETTARRVQRRDCCWRS
jgi:hypothetical protein